jgi:multiple sugar transport system substrate-binding protein
MRRRDVLSSAACVAAKVAATGAATGAMALRPSDARAAAAAAPPCDNTAGLQADIHLIGNALPAVQHLAARAHACNSQGLKVTFKITPQARIETERAFAAAGRSPFDAAVISAGAFSNLYSRQQLAPMTDLVARFGARYRLEERMLVRVNGEVMALAFMQNTQNLVYRQDLFEKHRLAVPTTHAQLLQAAITLQAQEPGMAYPLAQGYAKGFDVAVEFTNVLASLGGQFFEPGRATPAFQSALGQQAVAAMRTLLPVMTPNALASNTDDVMNLLQQGKAAMGVLWATRASRMDDPVASKVVGRMAFAAAPSVLPGGRTAAHLWWDGVAMPRNMGGGGARREAVFHVLMEMLSEPSVQSGNELAIWVRSAYRPGRFGTGVALAQAAGALAWPAEPFFSLAHGELGKALPDALVGTRPIADVLNAAAAAYQSVAAEKGFLNSAKQGAS